MKLALLVWLPLCTAGIISCNKEKDPPPSKPDFTKLYTHLVGGSEGDDFSGAIATADGGYIVTGSTNSNDGDFSGLRGRSDGFVIKYNASGAIQWKKTYGGTEDEGLSGIQATADGGYLVTGWTWSQDGDLTANKGKSDYWILKISSTGNKEWSKSYGGPEYDYSSTVLTTADGGYIITGHSNSTGGDVAGQHQAGSYDAWIIKLNGSGALQWSKAFGGTQDDYAGDMINTADGNYLMTGITRSTDGDLSSSAGNADGWLLKFSPSGALLWSKTYGGSMNDFFASITVTSDGGYLINGSTNSNDGPFSSNHGNYDALLLKVSSTGNVEWNKLLGGKDYDDVAPMVPLSDGNYLMGGNSYSLDGGMPGHHGKGDVWLMQVNSSGMPVWNRQIGGSNADYISFIIRLTNNQYVAGGFTQSNDHDMINSKGKEDAWLLSFE